WRKRRRGARLWPLLGIMAAGAAGAAAVVILTRRRTIDLAPLSDPLSNKEGGEHHREPTPAPPSPDIAVWIAGPAGNLYVRDGGEEAGGVPVLFVHSLGGNGGQWTLQLDHLRRHRRAAALDLRGHGDSDPAEDGDYSIAGLAADVAAAADQLDLRHFVLAGHSLGASVAVEYAGRHPERVSGLLLVDPNGDQTRIPAGQLTPFLEAVRAEPRREMEWYFRQILAGGDPSAAGLVLEDLRLADEGALTGALEAGSRYSPLAALARYDGPRLSIISDMNRLPFSLHNLIPDLPTRLLPGTGHWLMMDCPEPFNHLLDAFLAGVDERT
ncbi:MAG TPA: alpha/beta fold hydrolase, partial [Thermoanaerobaculia bacterium]|nr:alpha/beta fold hydrolase [Thermoanaerobaculia bacterium]